MKTEPIKLPPPHALKFFSQQIQGQWGGVPWDQAVSLGDNYWGLSGKLQRFPHPENALLTFAVAGATDCDTDTDGPGGSEKVDPCWQGETSLRYPDGSSCDSRTFPGLVIPPGLNAYGVHIGDFGYVSYGGLYMSIQVYDSGPPNKIGEAAERVGRGLRIIPESVSSHLAAEGGYPGGARYVYAVISGHASGERAEFALVRGQSSHHRILRAFRVRKTDWATRIDGQA